MVPRSRSLLDGLSSTAKNAAGLPSLVERCDPLFVVNQWHEQFSFGQRLMHQRALLVHTISMAKPSETIAACERMQQLRPILSDLFSEGQIGIASVTLEPDVSIDDQLQPLAAKFDVQAPDAEICEWHFLTAAGEVLNTLRKSLDDFDLNPYVYQNVMTNTSMVVFGNGQTNRWAGLPIGLSQTVLIQAIRRVCGFTYLQRYGWPDATDC